MATFIDGLLIIFLLIFKKNYKYMALSLIKKYRAHGGYLQPSFQQSLLLNYFSFCKDLLVPSKIDISRSLFRLIPSRDF